MVAVSDVNLEIVEMKEAGSQPFGDALGGDIEEEEALVLDRVAAEEKEARRKRRKENYDAASCQINFGNRKRLDRRFSGMF